MKGLPFICTNKHCIKFNKIAYRKFDMLSTATCYFCEKPLTRYKKVQDVKSDKIAKELLGHYGLED